MTGDARARLAAVAFLSSLEPRELERLAAQARVTSAAAGEVLIREGELGDRMYVIDHGSVQVSSTGFDGDDVVLARLEPGQWSPQLFRYAGYARPEGTVLGDPANMELTEVAQALGWRPPEPRGAFDLLPVIVQAVGERPVWREIPRRLVLEIPIAHPQFPWFADLGLRWYALPAVSGMRLDAGGLQYPAAPFNGWYMVTEIGARNFGDISRYNLLPVVARKMGLDTASDRTLWRDRALVELNVAVLHSYERAGVTMLDHHAASHAFDKFEALETQAGRVVHARWSWIVPPISGSAVTVFHKDHWKDIELTPNYCAQPDPWKEDAAWRRLE